MDLQEEQLNIGPLLLLENANYCKNAFHGELIGETRIKSCLEYYYSSSCAQRSYETDSAVTYLVDLLPERIDAYTFAMTQIGGELDSSLSKFELTQDELNQGTLTWQGTHGSWDVYMWVVFYDYEACCLRNVIDCPSWTFLLFKRPEEMKLLYLNSIRTSNGDRLFNSVPDYFSVIKNDTIYPFVIDEGYNYSIGRSEVFARNEIAYPLSDFLILE
ncbi:MAG: hypothetical protein HWE24_00555 [Oceanospirillaceae bacterium]|nr:hypothetical protein [Oceanospirillaceae bacterium]